MIFFIQSLTEAYILLITREITKKKKPKPKAITRDKMGRNQKIVTKRSQRQKARKVNSGKNGEQCCMMNSARMKKISQAAKFFL